MVYIKMIFACFLLCLASSRRMTQGTSDNDVFNEPLNKCSRPGEATTGYTRTGYCNDVVGDEGTHHICVDLHTEPNFCQTTRQGNWCDESQATRTARGIEYL